MPNIVVFDTETTGTDCEVDRLVEIAGVCYESRRDEFSTLVNPGRDIPAEARAIHHIGPKDVERAPDEKKAVDDFIYHFLSAAGPIILCAHNAKFDAGFIRRIYPENIQYIDTLKLAYLAWPDAPKFTNQVLRYWLELEVEVPEGLFPHRALYDCIVTRAILTELFKHFTLGQMINISAGPVFLPRVFFGKHKGKTWDEVDYGYLKWCKTNMTDDENVQHTVEQVIKRRYK